MCRDTLLLYIYYMVYDKIVYNKYFVYFLGFLWSDGFVERKRVGVEIVKDDAIMIVDDIKKIDFLNICTMERHRDNRRPQMTIYFCNVEFYDNFISKYFINKSYSSPSYLLELIPDDFKRFFYQGLIDGDGCFYFNLKNKTRQFYVTSSYDQDWTHVVNLFDLLCITQYEIRKVINKNGNRSSYIRVKKHNEIESLYNYLYPNGYEFGLKRKYNKCSEIVDNPPKNSSNKSKIDLDELKMNIESGAKILELSKIYDCNWRKIYDCCKKNNIKYDKGFFLGITTYKIKKPKISRFLPYEDAKLYVQGLGIKNQKEWNIFSKINKPNNIPSNPQKIYKDCGWVSLKDWLGH